MWFTRVALIFASVLPMSASAQLLLPNLFSDHAVLQRGQPVRVWGWTHADDKVTVSFHDQKVHAQADALGEWEAWLNPESAGGPFTLEVSSESQPTPIKRSDILVGDVWFASGQSNMQLPLRGWPDQAAAVKDADKEIAAADHPLIRLFLQKTQASDVPLFEASGSWSICSPESAKSFSAIAYFFGREISEREKVPIGLIDSTLGGTPVHSWISLDALGSANLVSVFEDAGALAREQARASETHRIYTAQDAALKAEGKSVPNHPRIPNDRWGAWLPGALFNGMIAPFTRYAIKGVIWYQGESDADPKRGPHYGQVFSALITDWRQQWGEGDFPFLYAQISSFGTSWDGWARVREAQRQNLALRNTGMAVTLDVGVSTNIHPPDKQTVAARLALNAREIAYGEKIDSSSPNLLQATVEADAMRVWLTHAEGLTAHDQKIGGFEVAGDDRKFKPAIATIQKIGDSETLRVVSTEVSSPRFVRYGWTGNVTSYLYNAEGLPLGTFTSEN